MDGLAAAGRLREDPPGGGDHEGEHEARHPLEQEQARLDLGDVGVVPGHGLRRLARLALGGAGIDERRVDFAVHRAHGNARPCGASSVWPPGRHSVSCAGDREYGHPARSGPRIGVPLVSGAKSCPNPLTSGFELGLITLRTASLSQARSSHGTILLRAGGETPPGGVALPVQQARRSAKETGPGRRASCSKDHISRRR